MRKISERTFGFTLMELLVVTVLLGTFSLLACAFFNTLVQTNRRQSQVQAQMMGAEAALEKLRREVWACDKFEVADGHHLVVTSGLAKRATWVLSGEGLARREEGVNRKAGEMVWRWNAGAWEFSALAAGVKVADWHTGATRIFVAELRRLNGGKP